MRAAVLGVVVISMIAAAQSSPADSGADPLHIQQAPLSAQDRSKLTFLLHNRDLRAATSMVEESAKTNPKSAGLNALLGRLYFLGAKPAEAAAALQTADSLQPLTAEDRLTWALACAYTNRRDEALSQLNRLIQAAPRNGSYYYWVGRINYDGQHYDLAVQSLRKSTQLEPQSLKAYETLGLSLEALGKADEAAVVYRDAAERNLASSAKSPWPPLNLGALEEKQGDLADAEKHLREAVQYDGTLPQAHYRLGRVLEKRNQTRDAVNEERLALTYNPTYAEPYYVLGRLYKKLGDPDMAAKCMTAFQHFNKAAATARKPISLAP